MKTDTGVLIVDGSFGDCLDFDVHESARISRELADKEQDIKLLEDVFGYMVGIYEGIVADELADPEYHLDLELKNSIKNMARDVLIDHSGNTSIYKKIYEIVKTTIGVIQMSDDCSPSVSSGISNIRLLIEPKLLEYVKIIENGQGALLPVVL